MAEESGNDFNDLSYNKSEVSFCHGKILVDFQSDCDSIGHNDSLLDDKEDCYLNSQKGFKIQ